MLGDWQIDPEVLLALRLSRVHDALSKQQFAQALSEVEELLDEHPGHQIGLFLSGQAALGMGDAVGSLVAFRHCAVAAPSDPTIQLGLAVAAFESAAYTASLQASRLTTALAPDSAQGWYYQGLVEERTGQPKRSAEAFHRAHRLSPVEAPLPLEVSEEDWLTALKEALTLLPTPLQAFYIQVPIRWMEFPELAHLCTEFPPLSPLSGALYVGQPPEEDDPWQNLPREVRLFRGNLRHPIPPSSSLVERISASLLHEAMNWTGAAAEDILPD